MDQAKQALKGSPRRDAFKQWHKPPNMPNDFYACDLDFVLVVKKPIARIVAILDYKRDGEGVTFSEVIAYNNLTDAGWPIYLVSTEPDMPPYATFTVVQYVSGDWRPDPPKCELATVLTRVTHDVFRAWEAGLRS